MFILTSHLPLYFSLLISTTNSVFLLSFIHVVSFASTDFGFIVTALMQRKEGRTA
jgi:hypothetical protein